MNAMEEAMHPDKVFICVNDRRISLADLTKMKRKEIRTVYARGCTALDTLNAPNAEINRNPYVFGGVDQRGYLFEGVFVNGQWRVIAGCRNHSIGDALKHWGPDYSSSGDQAECLALVEKIAAGIEGLKEDSDA